MFFSSIPPGSWFNFRRGGKSPRIEEIQASRGSSPHGFLSGKRLGSIQVCSLRLFQRKLGFSSIPLGRVDI